MTQQEGYPGATPPYCTLGEGKKKRNKHKRWIMGRERRKMEKKKCKTEKERAHRVRKAVSEKKGCFSAY